MIVIASNPRIDWIFNPERNRWEPTALITDAALPPESVWQKVPQLDIVERNAPPAFEAEMQLLAQQRQERKSARKALYKLQKANPVSQWEVMPASQLGFKGIIPKEKKRAVMPPPKNMSFAERCAFHEERNHQWMIVAGLRMPALNGRFIFYAPKNGEGFRAWRNRLYRTRQNVRVAEGIQKAELVSDLPYFEQIRRNAQKCDGLFNPFSKLAGLAEKKAAKEERRWLWCSSRVRPIKKEQSKARVFGPKRVFGFEYQQMRLARKLKLALLQEEWRDARFLRREKMSRVLLQTALHRVKSLRSALEKVAAEAINKFARQERKDVQGQMALDTLVEETEQISPDTVSWIDELIALGHRVEGQMDQPAADAHGREETTIDSRSTAEIHSQSGASLGDTLPAGTPQDVYDELSAATSSDVGMDAILRWYPIWDIDWNATYTTGSTIVDHQIPLDILKDDGFRDSPNFMQMSRHMYWKGDIELKIVTNSNKRQYGQIQWSFYYGERQDSMFDLRNNIYSASQRLHALTDASVSNDVIVKIPFQYIFPIMAINRISSEGSKTLGRLIGKVIVPITAAPGATPDATIFIYVSFSNNKFSGMVSASLAGAKVEGQMLSLASIIACKSLLDRNRDAPSMTSPGTPVIPINSSSWCYGTGQSTYENILRLDPNCVLPYESGRVPSVDEMTVDFVKQRYGMLGMTEMKVDDPVGKQLWQWDASPLTRLNEYPSIEISSAVGLQTAYIVPPVGILSSLYAYWRGSLDLRVDIVGPADVSCSILIAYIPRYLKNENITMSQAKSCPYSVLEIKDNQQVNFNIPYVASHMFWPRYSTLSQDYPINDAPGSIRVYVFTHLVLNNTVPQEIKLIFYLKAGPDFEVAVPASPSVGLSFNPVIYVSSTVSKRIIPIPGYTPVYSGQWRYSVIADPWSKNILSLVSELAFNYGPDTPKGFSIFVPVLRYGEVTDHISQFRAINFKFSKNKMYCCTPGFALTGDFIFNFNGVRVSKQINHLLISYDGNYAYAWPYSTHEKDIMEKAVRFANALTNPMTTMEVWWVVMCKANNYTWRVTDRVDVSCESANYVTPYDFFLTITFPPLAEAQAGDESTSAVAPVASPQETAGSITTASKRVFGEQFLDLKDYCRRYQLYANGNLRIVRVFTNESWRTITLKFPVMPQGLELVLGDPAQINEYWNRTRDGPIPVIASAYRFFTGGIRFRICINCVSTDGTNLRGKIFVQHRPNIVNYDKRVTVQSTVTLNTEDMELPGYASYHQFDDINNVLSVEVPFYKPSLRTYLQRPSKSDLAERFSDLGELVIGVTVFDNVKFKFLYDIYYCLADDARFSVFVGFPPVISNTSIPSLNPPVQSLTADVQTSKIADCNQFSTMAIDALQVEYDKMRAELKDKYQLDIGPYNFKEQKSSTTAARRIVCSAFAKLEEWRKMPMTLRRASGDFTEIQSLTEKLKVEGHMGVGYSGMSKTVEKVDKLVDQIDEKTIEDLKETTASVRSMSDTVKDMFASITPTLDTISIKIQKYASLILNAVTNMCHLLLNLNLRSLGVAIVSFLVQLKIVCFSVTSSIAEKLSALFTTVSSMQPKLEATVEGHMGGADDEGDSLICGYASSLFAGVCALFSFVPKFCKARVSDFGSLLLDGIGKFTFTANNLFRFIKNNLVCIKHMGQYLFGNHPSIRQLTFLKDHEDIYSWAEKVVEYTDPRKENQIFTSPHKAAKVYILAGQAGVLQIKMLSLNLNPAQTSSMNILIKKICDLRDRLAKTHTAPPVRFEPFVYELYGSTGIGKSELLKSLPYDLFNYMGFKHSGELIYHRAVGNPYWNNLRNQPVCTIDEKFPIDAPGFSDVQLAELFQLKSSCVFNPPMADIPDKGIRYNPLIVQYASNVCFPSLSGVKDKQAVWRRRDALICVKVKEDLKARYGQLVTWKSLYDAGAAKEGSYDHLDFFFHRNVIENSMSEDAWGAPMSYEAFLENLCVRFKNFYTMEEKKYRREINRMRTLLPDDGDESTLTDMFDYKWLEGIEVSSAGERFDERERKFQDNYRKALKFSDKTQYFQKIIRLLWLEYSGEDIAQIKEEIKQFEIDHKFNGYFYTPTVQGHGNDETTVKEVRKPVCAHRVLQDVMFSAPGFVSWKEEKGWEVTMNSCMWSEAATVLGIGLKSPTDIMKEGLLPYLDVKREVKDGGDCLIFPHSGCKNISEECIFKDEEFRCAWVSVNWLRQTHIQGRLMSGGSLAGFIPKESLKRMYTVPEDIAQHIQVEEKLPEIKTFWQNFKESFYKIEWKKWLKRITIALTIFGFIGAALGLWNWYRGDSPSAAVAGSTIAFGGSGALGRISVADSHASLCDEVRGIIANGHVSGDYKTMKQNVKGASRPASKIIGQVLAQGGPGILQWDIISTKLQRNSFFFDFVSDLVPRNPGRCLGICGRWALIVDHYYDSWKKTHEKTGETEMIFIPVVNGKVSDVRVSFKEVVYRPILNSSLALIKLPKRIPNFKDIRSSFALKDQHKFLSQQGVVAELGLSRELVKLECHDVKFKAYNDKIDVDGCDLWDPFQVHEAYEYDGFTGKGKCGSVLLACGVQSPIVGVHVAGITQTNWGLSECVYREMFAELNDSYPDPIDVQGMGLTSTWDFEGQVIGLGKVPPKFAHQERGKSRIVPSEIQLKDTEKIFKIYSEPSVLSNHDKRISEKPFSPMIEGCKHHGKPLLPIKKEYLKLAIEDYKNLILAKCRPQRQQVGCLTVDEAVGGIDGKLGYEHIEFATSEGYPFVSMRPKGFSNKRWLFNFDEGNKYVSCSQTLSDILKVKWQQRLANKIPATVVTDCLKDCTVSKEKVLLPGKTRIFSMAPVDFTIQERQCTLDFVAAFMACRLDLEHMVGCNPDSFEWTMMARKLLEKGNNIITGDYSKYGDSLPFEFIKAAFKIIIEWYKHNGCEDEEMFQQLKIMTYEVGHSKHLMFDYIYQVVCGQPSGNSLTVILNSMANSLYLRCAWLHIMRETQYCSLADFHKFTQVFSYGDDLIVSIADEVRDYFNGLTLQFYFGSIKLKFTNADKSDNIVPFTSLANAEFLKRGFVNHPTRSYPKVLLAPLGVASIEDTVNWIWKESFDRSNPEAPTFRNMSVQVSLDSIRNAYGRGSEYYNSWSSKVRDFWQKRGVFLVFDTWEQMDHKIFNLQLDLSPYHKWTVKVPKS